VIGIPTVEEKKKINLSVTYLSLDRQIFCTDHKLCVYMYIYKKKIVNFYNRFGINDTNDDDDEYVYMLEYCIYAFIYNEDNYTKSDKKKILMTIWNVQGISNAIGNINRDHMTKKSTC
jgi:hypothetical protein